VKQEEILKQILEIYDIKPTEISLLGHSEKLVWKVVDEKGTFHCVYGYYPNEAVVGEEGRKRAEDLAAIASEMKLLEMLSAHSLGIAAPRRNIYGELVSAVYLGNRQIFAAVTGWIPGEAMAEEENTYLSQCVLAGKAAAKLHEAFAKIDTSQLAFPELRHKQLEKVMDILRQGETDGFVSSEQMKVLEDGGIYIRFCMDQMDTRPGGKSLVHTDLRKANFLMEQDRAVPVDFGRTVFGYPLYDLGEMCAHMGGDSVQKALFQGYASVKPLEAFDICCVEAMFVFFILSVVAETIQTGKNPQYVEETLVALTQRHIPDMLKQQLFSPAARQAALGR
jgi:Ser/Thr protein kinase RdoA (MazF antagonist)